MIPIFTIFLLDLGTVSTVWYFLGFFHLIEQHFFKVPRISMQYSETSTHCEIWNCNNRALFLYFSLYIRKNMIVCHDYLHLSFLTKYLKNRKRKPKKQSRMDNPDTQEIFGTRQRTNKNYGRWFSSSTPAFSTTKTGRHDITKILLKVALSTKKSINN